MANKKTTRRALVLSVISLILCCAMLTGTTFAWFTDSVASGRNTIQSGNLDVKLEYSKDNTTWTEVTSTTEIFDDAALWEPGYTQLVYFRVTNAGSLALKYNLSVDIYNEVSGVNVYGDEFKLSDHLKYGVVPQDKLSTLTDRASAAAYATTLLADGNTEEGVDITGTLEGLGGGFDQLIGAATTTTSLLPAATNTTALVITMPTTVDNVANHNGTTVPSIAFGINLLATQYTYEEDSFGNDYDENAEFPPNATNLPEGMESAIVESGEQYVGTTIAWGSYDAWSPSNPAQQLEAAYIFTTPHNASTIADYEYKDWECDYYVSIDTDIVAKSIFLGGNYGSFGWVGFENPEAITANTEIPLLGSVTTNPWTYEDIVTSVGTFTCGVAEAVDSTQDLAGATFTVKLRLTNPEDATEYYDVNTITYTFK